MAEYRCKNCDNVEEVTVTNQTITDGDESWTVKSSGETGCTVCGFTHWEDAE